MKLLFKQRIFSWFDSYDLYNENGETLFQVEGKLSWGHKLLIYDQMHLQIGEVKEEVLTLLPKFILYDHGIEIGKIEKEFTFFRPKFHLTCNDWRVEGDFMEWDYTVLNDTRIIMQASKELFHFSDTYVLDIERDEDALLCLMIVLAIDAAKCSRGD